MDEIFRKMSDVDSVRVFEKKRDFLEWARRLSYMPAAADSRLFVGYELISWALKATVGARHQKPAWAITEMTLPITPIQAKQAWDTIQEENLCLFFYLEQYVGGILVAVRNGVWKSLDNRYLPHNKGSFAEI